jgi:hypothetical protein
MNEQQL